MVTGETTDLQDKLDGTMLSVKFDLTEVRNVAKERHEITENNFFEFKKSFELKIQEVHDLIHTEVKTIDGLFLGV